MDLLGNLANLRVDTVLGAVDKYVPGAKDKVKNLADKAKAYMNNVSELELKVLEATNHDPWGPHGSVMQEITNQCFHSEGFYQVMGILDQRLQEGAENWRLVYKALLLLEYMVKHGPLSVAEALVSYSRLSLLEKLRDRFEFKEASGRDQGINVRQRAGALVALVQDNDKLTEERDKAAKNKSKYTGVSSSSMRYGGFGSGSSTAVGSSSSNYRSSSRDYDMHGSSSMGSHGMGGTGSSYRRSSSSAAGDGGSGGTAAAATGGADPVEATRQRIARLKADGALPAADPESPVGPGFETGDAQSPKKPKKLSEIRINPAISATFAKGGVSLAPPAPAGAKQRGGSSGGTAATGIDLLGDLDDTPAPAAAASNGTAAAGAKGLDDWDGFASAPTTAAGKAAAAGPSSSSAAAADEWAAFDSAPAATAAGKAKQPIDINSLLGPLPTTTPAAAGGSKGGPLPLDDFCSPAAPIAAPTAAKAPTSVPSAAAGFDPFGAPAAAAAAPAAGASAAAAADPFAASGVVHMVPQAPKQHAAATGPKLGPETAKAKDPFADLALI